MYNMYKWVYKPLCYYFTGYITGNLLGMLTRLKYFIMKDKYNTSLTNLRYDIEKDIRRMEIFGFSLGFFSFMAHDYLQYHTGQKQITSDVINLNSTKQ